MALKLNERYPARFDNPSADYPQGSFKNRTSPTAKDGSYLEKDWANDKEGFFQSLIAASGLIPSGAADKVGASQYYDAMLTVLYAAARKTPVLTDTGTAGAYAAANTPALTALPSTGYMQRVKISNANPSAATYAPDGLAPKPIYGLALQPLQGGELPVGIAVMMYLVQAGVNGGNGAWIIIESLGGALQVAPATKSMHAVQQSQLGNYNSFGYISASTSMTSAYLGKEYVVQGGAVQTLPPVSVAPAGSTINLIIYTATQIKGNGAELITMISGATSSNTINVNPGEQIQFVSNGLSWYIANYSLNAQYQLNTAFTTAGTAGALTLAPSPAIQAYSAPLRFRVKFSQNSAGADTINVSGQGPKSLKQYDSTGAKVAAVFAANQLADVEYDGTDFVLLDQLPISSAGVVQGAFSNLVVSTTGLSAVVTVTADELSVGNSSGGYKTLRLVSVTPSFSVAGANGIDVGAVNSQTVSTWYSVWVISNGASVAGLLSLSATAPTLPAGYTHKARVGWVFTDATANKYPLTSSQSGRVGGIKVVTGTNSASPRAIASGTTSSAYVATSISQYCPPTASAILLRLYSSNANGVVGAVAPNNSYGALTAGTPPSFTSTFAPLVISSPTNASPFFMQQGRLMLESSNIYYISNSSLVTLLADGWEDNL